MEGGYTKNEYRVTVHGWAEEPVEARAGVADPYNRDLDAREKASE